MKIIKIKSICPLYSEMSKKKFYHFCQSKLPVTTLSNIIKLTNNNFINLKHIYFDDVFLLNVVIP